MGYSNDDLIIKITRLEDFQNKCELDIERIKIKVEEEVNELKTINSELKRNLDKINGTLVRIQYTLIGGAIVVILSDIGVVEFLKKFLKLAM